MSKNKNKECVFKCIIDKEIYNSPDYKIYGAVVDTGMYPDIHINRYGNVTIVGNFHDLTEGVEYVVTSKQTVSKYGKQYEVTNIKRDIPTSQEETAKFLYEILTPNQADVLLEAYPDIVNKIIKDDLDDVDLSKTKGIKDKAFANIKNTVIENFALVEIIDKYGGNRITISMLKKLYDKYPSIEKVEEELTTNPYKSLCSISGIGFKKADTIILGLPNNKMGSKKEILKSKQRMAACMEYVLSENESDGHTKMDIIDMRKQCNELTPECIDHFVDIVKEDDGIYLDKATRSVAKTRTYETELYVANKIKEMLKNPRVYGFDWGAYSEIDGKLLTDQQLKVLENLCKYNISLLAGNAGAGKTFTMQSVIRMLDDNSLSYILMTPTGKSSDVLARFTDTEASTIHRGLAFHPKEGWRFNEHNKLKQDVVIVDETGMTDIFLMRRLFEAVDVQRTKVLFVQDPAQLPSVGAGNCSNDMIQSRVTPVSMLDKIFRYDEGGLYNVASKVRDGKYYIPKTDSRVIKFGKEEDYILMNIEQEGVVRAIVNLYEKLLSEGNTINDIIVLSHHNKGKYGTNLLNKKIQSRVNPPGKDKQSIKYGNNTFIVGDRVLQVVNNYKAENVYGEETSVFNGNTGTIIDIVDGRTMVEFRDETIVYSKDELNQLLLGYAVSIHKFQGDSSKNVIVNTPKAHTFFINRNLLYTAITRTQEKCYHFSNKKLIRAALRKSATKERNTFLKDMLIS